MQLAKESETKQNNYRKKTKLEVLIIESELRYTDFLLENLKELEKLGFGGAKELRSKLISLDNEPYKIGEGIDNPLSLIQEIKKAYWFPFELYPDKILYNVLVNEYELSSLSEDDLMKKVYDLYKKDYTGFIERLDKVLLFNTSRLTELSSKIWRSKKKITRETEQKIIDFSKFKDDLRWFDD